jgi:hypothetical protein
MEWFQNWKNEFASASLFAAVEITAARKLELCPAGM